MQKQKREIKLPLVIFMITLIIFLIIMSTAFGIKNKHHRDNIEIYEEYYIIDKEMDVLRRQWVELYQNSYGEEEYYLRFHTREYLRYLELEKIIGEIKE